MDKVGFGRVRVYPKSEMSGTGMSGTRGVGFGRVRVLKFRVRAGILGIEKSDLFHPKVQISPLLGEYSPRWPRLQTDDFGNEELQN